MSVRDKEDFKDLSPKILTFSLRDTSPQHEDKHKGRRGKESIGQYSSVHKDSFSNPPTNRRLEEEVVVDWSKMMEFKAS
ncbi:hypothetical protein AVEN_16476-1 [Araneus ventricosus]|uniref:Uncharacterized protein n=1 Tax=Araneus ventricosus TaxID=182803 RepID=A0A4Y2Q1J2_ARAVE|nr:hypothetical protein AVEN_16476-1 [Araneus ventricosus]